MFGIGSGKPPKKLFEFGSVEERDRMQIREVIAPGKLLDESCLPADVLVSGHSALPAVEVAKASFDIMRSMFEQPSAVAVLKRSPVIGVMTDSLDMNGFAMMLHLGEKYLISLNAGVMLRVTVSAYRLFGYREQQLGRQFMIGSARIWPNTTFPLPVDTTLRKELLRSAMYATIAIFSHEIAHCFRGHLGKSKMKLTEEFSAAPSNPEGRADDVRLAMEVDADEFSGRFLTDIFFRGSKGRGDFLLDINRKAEFESVATGVLLALSFAPKSRFYLSGKTRTFLILSGLLLACGNGGPGDGRTSAQYLLSLIDRLSDEMVAAGIEVCNRDVTIADERTELARALDARSAHLQSWLNNRPDWGGRGAPFVQ